MENKMTHEMDAGFIGGTAGIILMLNLRECGTIIYSGVFH